MTAPWVEAIAAIVAGTPKLPGALCRQHPALFDGEDQESADRAAAICQHCPAIEQCAAWAGGLKHNQAHGILAGEHRVWVSHPSVARKSKQ